MARPSLADLAYESAVRGEVERLEERRLAALEERIEADLAGGRHAEVLAELAVLTAQHPLRERLRAQHMLALYRSGRQADALAAYRDARRRSSPSSVSSQARRCGGSSGPCSSRTRNSAYPTPCRPRLGHALPVAPAPKHLWALAGAGALVLIAALAALLLMDGGRSSPSAPSVPGNSLAAIDPGTNRVVAEFPVGDTPTSVSVGAGQRGRSAPMSRRCRASTRRPRQSRRSRLVRFRSTWLPGPVRSGSCKARSPEHDARATTR